MFDWALDTLLLGFKNETYGSWCFQQKVFCFRLSDVCGKTTITVLKLK